MKQILSMKGDIFIHGGDFTGYGQDEHFEKFFDFLEKINFKHKIVIAGNHENVLSKLKLKSKTTFSREQILAQFKKRNVLYLQHEKIQLEGIKIFASPFTPQYCQKPYGRAFQYKPHHEQKIWQDIPTGTQLLLTHGPPQGILDTGKDGKRAGSLVLKQVVQIIKPKYHIFGHIHESVGMMKVGETFYLNVCNSPTRIIM